MKLSQLHETTTRWIPPNFFGEKADLEIVCYNWGLQLPDLTRGKLTDLPDQVHLQPDDYHRVKTLDDVKQQAVLYGKPERQVSDLIEAFRTGQTMEAPVILYDPTSKYAEVGSGNTRLMISKVLGIRPRVWLVQTGLNQPTT